MLSHIATLLLASLATAAPLESRNKAECHDGYNPVTGAYIDQGCGTAIQPNSTRHLCMRTTYNTQEGDPVVLGQCVAGGLATGGGRWAMTIGQGGGIVNKESKYPDFCITAETFPPTANTGLVMKKCTGQPSQSFFATENQLKFSGSGGLCVSFQNYGQAILSPCGNGAVETYVHIMDVAAVSAS